MSPMKAILLIFSLVSLTTIVVSEVVVPGVRVLTRSTRNSVRAPATCGGAFGPKCKDCQTLMSCLGHQDPVSSQKCADKDPKTPYCVRNSCSATPNNADESCKELQRPNFRCTGEGYYPDPDKCTRYYICPGQDEEAVAYECPTNYVYRSKARGCAMKLNAQDCPTVDCSKTPNEFGVYKTDPAYYYFCLSSKTEKKTFVMKCLDETNGQYDSNLGECSFRCSKEGQFVDVVDCTKYYNCYKVGTTFQVDRVKCPAGFSFDRLALRCVKKACTSEVTTLPPATGSSTAPNPQSPNQN